MPGTVTATLPGRQRSDTGYPGRMLWMTDTFGDHNGVSTVLRAVLREVRQRDLPVDLMICSDTAEPGDHLLVVKPVTDFSVPLYRHQPFRIPNYLSVQRQFRAGRYTRIMASTEGPMGLAALWLKKRFSVETSFFLHTDWMQFARDALSVGPTGLGYLEKALRIYYRRYNSLFVLNSDQHAWLTDDLRFSPAKVHRTAHWADPAFTDPRHGMDHGKFSFDPQRPVILYAGRISREKGVMELPGIYTLVRAYLPDVQFVVAGTGPAEEELKTAMPGAVFTGWIGHDLLPQLYRAADLLLLPSRFDTFSCVVLEALTCGLPVVAYNMKGPKDILHDQVNGFLVETADEMAGRVVGYLLDPATQYAMKEAALARAAEYRAASIMDRLLSDAGIETGGTQE